MDNFAAMVAGTLLAFSGLVLAPLVVRILRYFKLLDS